MTSNMGSSLIRENFAKMTDLNRDETIENTKNSVLEMLKQTIRPEFINRVDEIITFNRLTEENFLGIADIMLAELQQNLAERGLVVNFSEAVRQYLVKEAYSVTYGARNLRRTIQRRLEDPISEKIIDSFEHPISSIHIAVENDNISVAAQ